MLIRFIPWPPNSLTDDEIYYSEGRLHRPKSDRDLHILLAHEIAHILGADHGSRRLAQNC